MGSEIRIGADVLLRPVTDADRQFALEVYASTREMELSFVPWDDAVKRAFIEQQYDAQTAYYESQFPIARHDVIELTASGERVGRVYVDRSEERISILDVVVLPAYRCRGIGSAVVGSLVDEARSSGHAVQVYVETFNPSQNFFTSRGFTVTETVGINLKLVWSPNQKS
jgi:ribosomal protein S18 acetylase RimI-like enzyme